MRFVLLALVLVPAVARVAAAQAPAPSPAPANGQAQAASPAQTPRPVETYTYQPEGRRDPFLSLLGSGGTDQRGSRRGEGPAGLSVNEISVRGVLQSRGALVAMVQGPDTRTYIVHAGDKFFDGTVKSITTQGLIIVQEVNDPLSLVKQREIRKMLRSLEDAK